MSENNRLTKIEQETIIVFNEAKATMAIRMKSIRADRIKCAV